MQKSFTYLKLKTILIAKKITILSGSHVMFNPRVVKEANTLAKAGYNVTVLTIWTQLGVISDDKSLLHPAVVYIGIPNYYSKNIIVLGHKIKRKLAELINEFTPFESIDSINAGLSRLIAKAKHIPTDLFIGHQEVGLVAGIELLKLGKLVAFDIEDWYSEDLLPEVRKKRPIQKLRKLEKKALAQGVYVITTSNTMAQAMSTVYSLPRPAVIYNVFPRANVQSSQSNNKRICLCWFSQTVGPGRGLEKLMQALNRIKTDNWELHLIGKSSEEYLNKLLGILDESQKEQVFLHPFVPHTQLEAILGGMDIGLALEEPYCLSREHTITNKLFQYLQAGLAVIASDTAGQQEAFNISPESIYLVKSNQPIELTNIIDTFLTDHKRLHHTQKAAVSIYENRLNWERESQSLLDLVGDALSKAT